MSRYVPVKGYSGLVRDTETNAILNTNASEIEQARERKRLRKEKQEQETAMKRDLEGVKRDFQEMKEMLSLLLKRL